MGKKTHTSTDSDTSLYTSSLLLVESIKNR